MFAANPKLLTYIFCLLVVFLLQPRVCAQYGIPDSTFGNNGLVVKNFYDHAEEILSISVLTDGRILALCGSNHIPKPAFQFYRFNYDGSIDSSFGTNGTSIVEITNGRDLAASLVVLPDGKFVVAGRTLSNNPNHFIVARFSSEGFIDSTFGIDGSARIFPGLYSPDNCTGLLRQSDGKLIVAGTAKLLSAENFTISRLTPGGVPDSTFGINGTVITQIGQNCKLPRISLLPNRDIIAGGTSGNWPNEDIVLIKYKSDGAIDSAFGNNGIVISALSSSNESINCMLVQPDNKLVALGFKSNSNNIDTAILLRYNSNGTFDSTFGNNGIIVSPANLKAQYVTGLVQSDGKIMVGGSAHYFSQYPDMTVFRFYGDGSPDFTWGINGMAHTRISFNKNSCINSMAVQPDGSVVGGGSFYNNPVNLCMVRYAGDVQVVSLAKGEIQDKFSIYPNPANASITISYVLSKISAVTAVLYDLQGKPLTPLFTESLQMPGTYCHTSSLPSWLPAGSYVARLRIGDHAGSLIIIKL